MRRAISFAGTRRPSTKARRASGASPSSLLARPFCGKRLRGSRSAHRHLASGGATALFSPGVAWVDAVINDARTAAIVFSQGTDDLDFELWPAVNSVDAF